MSNVSTLTTAPDHCFRKVGPASDNVYLCRVNEDVDLCEALHEAAYLVRIAQAHSFEIGMGNGSKLHDSFAWMTHYVLETAEAVIHSVIGALEEA